MTKGQRSKRKCLFVFQIWMVGSSFGYVFRIWFNGVWPIRKVFSKLEYKHRFLLWRYQSKYPVWEAPWFWFFLKVGNVPKNGEKHNFENWDPILKFKSKRISSGIIPFCEFHEARDNLSRNGISNIWMRNSAPTIFHHRKSHEKYNFQVQQAGYF